MFCLLCKAKNTFSKNFSCLVSEQRCSMLIKSSFSVYLGNLCTSFQAFVNTQYQPISQFVTSSSQIVFCLGFFFPLWIEQISVLSGTLKNRMSNSYFRIKYFYLSCHSAFLLTAAIIESYTSITLQTSLGHL